MSRTLTPTAFIAANGGEFVLTHQKLTTYLLLERRVKVKGELRRCTQSFSTSLLGDLVSESSNEDRVRLMVDPIDRHEAIDV
jgi:hypothetical protein